MAQDQPTLEGLTTDVKVTSERLAQLEGAQIVAEERLKAIEDAQGVANTHLQDILSRLDELQIAPRVNNNAAPRNSTGVTAISRARRVPVGHLQHPASATDAATINQHQRIPPGTDEEHGDKYEDYSGDAEDDQMVNHHNDRAHRQLRFNRHGMARGQHRYDVRDYDHSRAKIKFTMPAFNGQYNPDIYLDWELSVEQKFACHDIPENQRVRAATSEFTNFASICSSEYCRVNANNIPTTWDALKRAMRQRYVPSYYARDKLNELQRLKQGSSSVEDYYQELQTGLMRCGLVETEDAMMARFLGGLNRDIHDILDYKEYNSITRLFHFACKAEREVQGRHNKGRGNFSAGRCSSWTPSSIVPSSTEATPPMLHNGAHPASSKSAPQSSEASKASSLAPTT